MASLRVAERYSRSLLELAIESSKVDRIYENMKHFQASLSSSDLNNLLMNPTIHGSRKNAILQKIFGSSWDVLTLKFIEVVTRKGREDVLPEIAKSFFEQYNEYKGITEVVVISAQPLNEDSLEKIKIKLVESGTTKANIHLVTRVDPTLIGGFILEYNNNQYDASVRGKLNKLRNKLT